MADPLKIPIRASTQDHLEIEDVRDDLMILKDGSCCLLLSVAAVNFGLLSEKEQEATIFAYAGLLNSLTFPMQILIRSQNKDVSSYLRLLQNEEEKQVNEKLKSQIQKYRHFIEAVVKENNVLDKKFYVILPFSNLELGIKSATTSLSGKKTLPFPKDYILEKAKISLFPRRDHLVRQMARIGLKSEQLKTHQLIELFYRIYNPESVGISPGQPDVTYTQPMVERGIK